MTTLIYANLISVITIKENRLHIENTSLKGKVCELEGENANLRLKIQALEMVQAKPGKAEDARQQYLEIQHTESIRFEEEDTAQADTEAEPTIPTSTTKRKGKKRLSIEAKLANLPVIKETILIPNEVKARPELWEEIGDVITKGL